ncbi:PREDICTED: WD repeat-containing protein 5-like isoform X2 [Nicrophorus vespilloides]|uniref:WD repeat-containing protein 5-like isoform X2 n=1 Tax=Nicrophorus vespilloides TaxID=110193 RepID=A0ABM1N610_NICVS|nr:PREDICTED: WD repeat-containing protein 5-like isoform X2 [Nicrophorus vespilloides]
MTTTAGYKAAYVQEQLNVQGPWKVKIFECPDEVTFVHYTELHEYLMAGFADGMVRAFKDNKCMIELKDKDINNQIKVTCIRHRPVSKNYPITNIMITTYSSGLIKGWNYNFQECAFTLQEQRKTCGVYYHPKLAKFITVGDNKKIYMYDEDSKRQERVLSASDDMNATDGHRDTVTTACFHPRQVNEIISGGMDGTIQFWDTRQPHAIRNIQGITIVGDGLYFSPNATEKDKPLRLWDYRNGKEIKIIETDKYKNIPLTCGKYITKTHVICGGGEPNFIRIVDMTKYENVALTAGMFKAPTNITLGPLDGTNIPKYVFAAGRRIYEMKPK